MSIMHDPCIRVEKRCFVYCGPERCDCVAGAEPLLDIFPQPKEDKSMPERQWGFTPAGDAYPPYFNVTELPNGMFRITVRSPASDGHIGAGLTSAMMMGADEFRSYIRQLAADLDA